MGPPRATSRYWHDQPKERNPDHSRFFSEGDAGGRLVDGPDDPGDLLDLVDDGVWLRAAVAGGLAVGRNRCSSVGPGHRTGKYEKPSGRGASHRPPAAKELRGKNALASNEDWTTNERQWDDRTTVGQASLIGLSK